MSSKETKVSTLGKLLNGYSYALVDTCSLMEDSFEIWVENLKKVKKDLKKEFHIYVLGKCEEELRKHSNAEDKNKAKVAKKALEILKKQKKDHLLEITKIQKGQNFADNTIYNQVAKDRINYKIIVITQDKSLATDLNGLNNLMSQRGFKVATYKIDSQGILKVNKGETKLVPAKEPEKQPKEVKKDYLSYPKKKNVSNQDLLLQQAISADKKLKCNLFNSNYPKEKKLADIKAQQELLLKISPAKKRTIEFSFTSIELKKAAKATSKDQPYELPKKEEKKVEQSKQNAESPKKEAKPSKTEIENNEISVEDLWYEHGNDLMTSLTKSFIHYGFIVRDPSIKFVKGVHGDLNITSQDIANFVSKHTPKTNGLSETKLRGIRLIIERNNDGFKTWLDLSTKPTNVKAKKVKEDAKSSSKNPAKVEDNGKNNANMSNFQTDVVSKPKQSLKKGKKNGLPKEDASKAEASVKQPKETKLKKQKQKGKSSQEPNQPSPEFLACKKAEERLRSVLSNTNYPIEDKIADLQKQLDEVRKLKPEEASQLVYGVDALKGMIGMMKSSSN